MIVEQLGAVAEEAQSGTRGLGCGRPGRGQGHRDDGIAAQPRSFCGVPSSSISRLSIAASTWSLCITPSRAGAISVRIAAIASLTPKPPRRGRRRACRALRGCPVEAPEGAIARPVAPEASDTSASTVGRPRESHTSRARMRRISLIAPAPPATDEPRRQVRRWCAPRPVSDGATRPSPPRTGRCRRGIRPATCRRPGPASGMAAG